MVVDHLPDVPLSTAHLLFFLAFPFPFEPALHPKARAKVRGPALELDEKYRKAKDLVEQNYRHIHRAESPLRHSSSFQVHRRLSAAPQANRISIPIHGNPRLSTGFAVSFAVKGDAEKGGVSVFGDLRTKKKEP